MNEYDGAHTEHNLAIQMEQKDYLAEDEIKDIRGGVCSVHW